MTATTDPAERDSFCVCPDSGPICPDDTHTQHCSDLWRRLAARLAVERARAAEDALTSAADAIQAIHPGEVKNSVVFLRRRAAETGRAADPHRPRVATIYETLVDLVKPTHAEDLDLRQAYNRDVWAQEWNSLPTAIDRVLADHIEQATLRLSARPAEQSPATTTTKDPS